MGEKWRKGDSHFFSSHISSWSFLVFLGPAQAVFFDAPVLVSTCFVNSLGLTDRIC